jgi:hypothetical protein
MDATPDRRVTWIATALRMALIALVGIAATVVAVSAACRVASVRGPQFDVVLGPIDPAIEGAEVFVVGMASGAIAVVCAIRLWRHTGSGSARRGPWLRDSND